MAAQLLSRRATSPLLFSVALSVSAIVGVVSARWPSGGLLLIGTFGFVGLLAASGAWRSVELALVLVSACAGLLISVHIGPISVFGLATAALAMLVWLTWIWRSRGQLSLPRSTLPLVALVLWGALALLARDQLHVQGAQNVLALALFAGTIAITAVQAQATPDYLGWLERAMYWAAGVSVALFVVGACLPSLGQGAGLGPRGAAAFNCVVLAWWIARWRYGSRPGLVMATVLVVVIGASLSRTALAVALALLVLAQFKPRQARDWLRLGVVCLAVLTGAYLGVTRVSVIRERFAQGDIGLSIAGVPINTEGRTHLWRATWDSYRQAPLLGHGPGSAQELIARLFPGIDQPHQDYLRVLHDYGLFGLLLWLSSFVALLSVTWRAWQRTPPSAPLAGSAHLAAFLGLSALALLMLTDNVLVYAFVLAPLGVMVGASLGVARTTRAPAIARPGQPVLPAARAAIANQRARR